jgi:tetratricopeptide (TPR) repeat protein
MRRDRKPARLILALIAAAGLRLAGPLAGQEVDPFYLKALADGEVLFKAKSYSLAVPRLEAAAFGLYAQPAALGKARLLLGLSHAYLNHSALTESYLKAAYAALGPAGLAEVPLPDSARADLLRLIRTYKLEDPAPAPIPAPPPVEAASPPSAKKKDTVKNKTALPPVDSPARDRLEKTIRETPRQAAAYYELAARHEAAGDRKSAVRVYQDLLDKIPTEIRACLEIGRLRYFDRSLKDAEKWLEKFVRLAADVPTGAPMLAAARAYLILSSHLRGDAAKTQSLVRQPPRFDDPLIESLGLLPEDRDRLLRILGR